MFFERAYGLVKTMASFAEVLESVPVGKSVWFHNDKHPCYWLVIRPDRTEPEWIVLSSTQVEQPKPCGEEFIKILSSLGTPDGLFHHTDTTNEDWYIERHVSNLWTITKAPY